MTMSRLDHRTGLSALGLFVLQLLIVLAIPLATQGHSAAIAVLVGAAALTLAGAALAFPAWVLLLSPLLIVLPVRVLTFYAFEWLLMAGLATSALLHASGRRTWPAPAGDRGSPTAPWPILPP